MLDTFQRWFGGHDDTDSAALTPALFERVEPSLPCLSYLPGPARARLRELARAFLHEKQFHGAHDMALSDEIMLSIALQASLPILRLGLDGYRHWVGIVVYPGDFVVEREVMDEDGVVHDQATPLLGEAWHGGPVVVSWNGDGAADGVNVLIHEFAHTLDMLNGQADGYPPLPGDMSREAWASAFSAAYDDLCHRVDHDRPTALDPYASEHPAEFFAVASEVFFERPQQLLDAYPEVYRQLAAFYGVDPARGTSVFS
ncbi:M90 family metallopeptidase [Nitrogeniibacter aestuarii]|uniref:M90 family metallopeptidase n=1 Tax=Nitrogeniibacter aestuarii TaxID=2815343 RepID=UPI001D0F75D7|nr:M90 family metallopeptidase [Nitrogeniibacter aestuarii]